MPFLAAVRCFLFCISLGEARRVRSAVSAAPRFVKPKGTLAFGNISIPPSTIGTVMYQEVGRTYAVRWQPSDAFDFRRNGKAYLHRRDSVEAFDSSQAKIRSADEEGYWVFVEAYELARPTPRDEWHGSSAGESRSSNSSGPSSNSSSWFSLPSLPVSFSSSSSASFSSSHPESIRERAERIKKSLRNTVGETGEGEALGASSLVEQDLSGFVHTEITMCSKKQFPQELNKQLHELLSVAGTGRNQHPEYMRVPPDLWEHSDPIFCEKLAYGGSDETGPCSGVTHDFAYFHTGWPLMGNANPGSVEKFLLGSSMVSLADAHDHACAGECGNMWAGNAYGPIWHNCNSFTATVSHCHLNLTSELPMFWSKMSSVSCPC
eukprot:TRINITY_DN11411_c0_g3_i1.p1 TRINITY_DN11411_c0_g3~~TRINITY_DN11411_c0_g3_i1.p1  ORF type:complete len:377 (+),score=53.99 TRINITY_DN11411_c0_g3_i1:67-1197(+)